jgi:NTP pyrophosphatase (non-canonical NTP hydrolase)
MALSVEASELMEEFLWLTEEQSRNLTADKLSGVKDEIGDVLNYTLRLCSRLNIDPIAAVTDKIEKNRKKYPVELAKTVLKKTGTCQLPFLWSLFLSWGTWIAGFAWFWMQHRIGKKCRLPLPLASSLTNIG